MTWKEDLSIGKTNASFRGVPFYVSSIDTELGRRTVVHKFPGKEFAFVQDLGRDTNRFDVQAFVIGDNYHLDRDNLLDALLQEGQGQLNHPYRGILAVSIVGPVKVSESKDGQGFATINFSAVEVAEPVPIVRSDTRRASAARADAAFEASAENFTDVFSATGADTSSINAMVSANTAIRRANEKITTALNVLDRGSSQIANIGGGVASLITSPVSTANAVGSAASIAFNSINTGVEALNVTLGFLGSGAVIDVIIDTGLGFANTFGSDFLGINRGTDEANRLADNQDAAVLLTRTAFLAETAKVVVDLPIESRNQAARTRSLFTDAISDLQLSVDDASYDALSSLRAALIAYFDEVAGRLPEVATFVPSTTLPSILIAQLLYGDVGREAEISTRNDLRHPGFVSEGSELEVLVSA